ncbi:purine-nucleoside phosphorylase [Membranihabitans maritimus]|uniref:purine-nucleoside phosphorylase n=1 Tax=Membranihabitans maritimus TaxID=2904244 RepID=UPI001F0316D4|nr:purine-nucleoside phosphorylase [Membranihabitans maritimus]
MELVIKLNLTKKYLEPMVDQWPEYAIILGSGHKEAVNHFHIHKKIPLKDIPQTPSNTLPHMDSTLYLATVNNRPCWIVGGRVHYYEGYSMEEIIYTVRFLSFCGVENFLLTNASGSVNPELVESSLVIIKDHINWSLPSPLIGENEKFLGPRFPEMIHAYDQQYIKAIKDFCKSINIQINDGIYLGVSGPQLETTAEYRLFRQLGADIIGMSTIPEVIAIKHMGKKCTAISTVSNSASNFENIQSISMDHLMANISARTGDLKKIADYWVNI